MKKRFGPLGLCIFALVLALAWELEAQAPPASADSHPVVESYYKIAAGKVDDWAGTLPHPAPAGSRRAPAPRADPPDCCLPYLKKTRKTRNR